LFILINGFFIYRYNPYNYYFNSIKKIIPYPAMTIGNRIITVSRLNNLVDINRKIYENAYRVSFGKTKEGINNLEVLRKNTKEELINNIIMEDILKEIDKSISNKEVISEYKKLLSQMGSNKDIEMVLKYSSNIKESDIIKKIYIKMLKERVSENVLYNLKMKVLLIKPDNKEDQADWDIALGKSQKISQLIREDKNAINEYLELYQDKSDYIVQNFGREYYFLEDLPEDFREVFKSLKPGSVSDPVKGDSGYYIFKVEESRGHYLGTLDDFLKSQREKLEIRYFIR